MNKDTHLKALRAAQSVVSAGHRRAGVLTAAALIGGAAGCSSGGDSTGVEGNQTTPEVSEQDTGSGQDIVGSDSVPTDVIVASLDATTPPEDAASPVEDATGTDDSIAVTEDDTAVTEDAEPAGETSTADTSVPPLQPVEGTCVFSTGQQCDGGWISWSDPGACTEDADCDFEGQFEDFSCVDTVCKMAACVDTQLFCIEGTCHNGQMGPDMELSALAEACCFAAYDSEEFWVPFGCTPWGPPAPPSWDGRTLLEYA